MERALEASWGPIIAARNRTGYELGCGSKRPKEWTETQLNTYGNFLSTHLYFNLLCLFQYIVVIAADNNLIVNFLL